MQCKCCFTQHTIIKTVRMVSRVSATEMAHGGHLQDDTETMPSCTLK